jgi:hypothetical protein
MSPFIHSIWEASFSESPPESNVMPFPVTAMGRALPAPLYVSSMSRGSFRLPAPTPRIPPKPPFFRSATVQTLHCRPFRAAILRASLASASGVSSRAGVLTRSRAQLVASAVIRPRSMASRTALRLPLPIATTLSRTSFCFDRSSIGCSL